MQRLDRHRIALTGIHPAMGDAFALMLGQRRIRMTRKGFRTHTTAHYVRKRQFSPGRCQRGSYRTITLSRQKGVKGVICRPEGSAKTRLQSILEPRGAKSSERYGNLLHSDDYEYLFRKDGQFIVVGKDSGISREVKEDHPLVKDWEKKRTEGQLSRGAKAASPNIITLTRTRRSKGCSGSSLRASNGRHPMADGA